MIIPGEPLVWTSDVVQDESPDPKRFDPLRHGQMYTSAVCDHHQGECPIDHFWIEGYGRIEGCGSQTIFTPHGTENYERYSNRADAIQRLVDEMRRVDSEWVSVDDRLPDDDTPVLIRFLNGKRRIGELRWERPGYEDTFRPYRYWDDPEDEGQTWEWGDITHWRPLP